MDSLYDTIYIGNKPGSENIYTHAQVIDQKGMIIESAVLAGPVTVTQTITVTGTLVII